MRTEPAVTPGKVAAEPTPIWATLVATVFGIGRLQSGPGTWASLAAALIWMGLSRLIQSDLQTPILATLAAIVILVGIPAATRVAKASGIKDPQFVVIDEVAGQWVTLLFVPVAWKTV